MYQQEMFSNGTFKGAKFIANGCYGRVFNHPSDSSWVIKYAKVDGTLNYLKWCHSMQLAGKHMRGMPVIDVLTKLNTCDEEAGQYMVIMEKYSCAREFLEGYLSSRNDIGDFCADLDHPYIADLLYAYRDYCRNNFEGPYKGFNYFVNDLHKGNIMWCNRTMSFVITDPSSNDYLELRSDAFGLTVQ